MGMNSVRMKEIAKRFAEDHKKKNFKDFAKYLKQNSPKPVNEWDTRVINFTQVVQ